MKHPTEFKIQLNMMPDAGLKHKGTIPLALLDLEKTEYQEFTGDLAYDLLISRPSETTVLVRGALDYAMTSECALCLEHFQEKIHIPEICYYFEDVESDCIDLTDMIREDILLALPLRSICKEDCAGLCSQCGKNLNLGECDCVPFEDSFEEEEVSGIWSGLDQLDLSEKTK